MRRHEALRTTFTAVDGQSLQVIASDLKWMAIVSLRELFETERQQESQRLITESVQQSFDLASGPLLRAVLQQLSEIEHILLLTIHEIVGDDWSLGVLLQELATLYEAFSNGLPELHNLYVPTEAAIDVTFWQCQRESNLKSVPIGRAIANTQLYILDSHLQAVPLGAIGELYIGGIGVARGYLNRPDLTAERFISHPFNEGEKLYKTGDLARKCIIA